ncbi:MAG: hypothetical protein EXQ53_02545 [Acidobacteria bacterium]|nr:hypothetical protein [Acidobacteriota bacterium]
MPSTSTDRDGAGTRSSCCRRQGGERSPCAACRGPGRGRPARAPAARRAEPPGARCLGGPAPPPPPAAQHRPGVGRRLLGAVRFVPARTRRVTRRA